MSIEIFMMNTMNYEKHKEYTEGKDSIEQLLLLSVLCALCGKKIIIKTTETDGELQEYNEITLF